MRRALAPMGRFPSTFTATLVTEPPCSKAMGGVSLQPPATGSSPAHHDRLTEEMAVGRLLTCEVQSGGTLHLVPLPQRRELVLANGDELV